MTILELLQSDETPCVVQGSNTRIIRNWRGDFEVLKREKKFRDSCYTIQLYYGNIESVAVTAFITGEKL